MSTLLLTLARDFRQSMSDKKKSDLTLKDPKLLALMWTKETVYFAWTRVFSTLLSALVFVHLTPL